MSVVPPPGDGRPRPRLPHGGLRSVIPRVNLEPLGAVERPNSARMVDYFLGGAANFEADRRAAAELLAADSLGTLRVRANRAFVARALRWCVRRGVDQILDLGCGLSSVLATHSVARAVEPGVRVAYVDVDPVVTEHLSILLAGLEGVSVTRADLGDPGHVLGAPGVRAVLDLARPVVVMATGSPHWVPGDLRAVVAAYRAGVSAGSVLVLSQRTRDNLRDDRGDRFEATMADAIAPMVMRTHAEMVDAYDTFGLVDPGVVDVADWPRPPGDRPPMSYWCGVGIAE